MSYMPRHRTQEQLFADIEAVENTLSLLKKRVSELESALTQKDIPLFLSHRLMRDSEPADSRTMLYWLGIIQQGARNVISFCSSLKKDIREGNETPLIPESQYLTEIENTIDWIASQYKILKQYASLPKPGKEEHI